FIPIVNLTRPYRRAREIWQGSDPETDPRDPAAWHAAEVSPLLNWWWGVFLIAGIVANAAGQSSLHTQQPSEIFSSLWLGVIGDGLHVVAALLAIQVVRRITERQEERCR